MPSPHTPLIDVEELHDLVVSGQAPVIVDCRFSLQDVNLGRSQYREGHIPGAVYADLNQDLSSVVTEHGGRHPLPDLQSFAERMSAFGVDSDARTPVVVYDDSRFGFASRLWWLLRFCGHLSVRVLNGGFSAWKHRYPVVSEESQPMPGRFVAHPDWSLLANLAEVRAISQGQLRGLLIDSREPARYAGEVEPIDPVAGHIPGAINHPWQQSSSEQGQMDKTAQEERWTDLPADLPVVVYCGSGVTACANLLAMEVAGYRGARLYAGSWSDWCSYPDHPVATMPGA